MKRVVPLVVLTFALLLVLAGTALAATPQDIYNDYAADGKLKGPYTMAELEAYLTDATVKQYGSAGVLNPLDALVTKILAVWRENPDWTFAQALKAATGSASGKDKDRKKFPFTGFEMFLAGVGGLALIGGGIAVRRTTK